MTATVRAADLPQGTVVTNGEVKVTRVRPGPGYAWHGTNGRRYTDDGVDVLLFPAGFVVLRKETQ